MNLVLCSLIPSLTNIASKLLRITPDEEEEVRIFLGVLYLIPPHSQSDGLVIPLKKEMYWYLLCHNDYGYLLMTRMTLQRE